MTGGGNIALKPLHKLLRVKSNSLLTQQINTTDNHTANITVKSEDHNNLY